MRNPFPFEEDNDGAFHRAIWQGLTSDYFYTTHPDEIVREMRMTELLEKLDYLTEDDKTRCLLDYRLHIATNLGGAVLGDYDE